jgi:hypothetical protein
MINNDGEGGNLYYGDGGDFPQFQGQTVDANAVLIKYTYLGDANLDGIVDSVDFSFFQSGYTLSGPYTGWTFGDFDYNGVVDSVDFSLFQGGYLYAGPPLAPALAAEITSFGMANGMAVDPAISSAAVPEPVGLSLLAFGAGALGLRRRRKN